MYKTIHSKEPRDYTLLRLNVSSFTLSSKFSFFALHTWCLQLHLAYPALGKCSTNLLLWKTRFLLELANAAAPTYFRSSWKFSPPEFVCFFSQICKLGGFREGGRVLEIFSVSRWRSSTRGQSSVFFLWRIFAIWRQQFSRTNYVEYSLFFQNWIAKNRKKKNWLKISMFLNIIQANSQDIKGFE